MNPLPGPVESVTLKQGKSPEVPAPDFSKDEAKALAMAPQEIVRMHTCIYTYIYIYASPPQGRFGDFLTIIFLIFGVYAGFVHKSLKPAYTQKNQKF